MLQRVLRIAALVGVAVMPAAASAATGTAPPVTIKAYTVPRGTYPGVALTAALSNGPSRYETVKIKIKVQRTVKVKIKVGKKHKTVLRTVTKTKIKRVKENVASAQDWMVVSASTSSDLLSVSPTGQMTLVATGLLPQGNVPSGQISALPGYGSVEADGRVWLLDYSVSPAPLYAIGPGGAITLAASLQGDFTGLTVSGNTLLATDNSGFIDKCAISKQATASCTAVPVPLTFDNGQVDAIGTAGGHFWFTDDSGELGLFRAANNSFSGPFGDHTVSGVSAGEASSDLGTITASSAGALYLAGGQEADADFQNNLILRVNTKTGGLAHTYSTGLTNVVAMTGGADGNIWFLDETNSTTGVGKVGMLNTTTGRIYEYALPKGYRLPASAFAIGSGPQSSDTVFFTLQTTVGAHAAVGVVSGI